MIEKLTYKLHAFGIHKRRLSIIEHDFDFDIQLCMY